MDMLHLRVLPADVARLRQIVARHRKLLRASAVARAALALGLEQLEADPTLLVRIDERKDP